MQHEIETKRLILRQTSINDLDNCLEMDVDYEVSRFISDQWNGSKTHRTMLKANILRKYVCGLGYWSIFYKQTNLFLGLIILVPYHNTIEIGWRLKRSEWNKGYGIEAAQAVIKYAFTTLKLQYVYAYIDFDNKRSIKVAKKLGFNFFCDFIYEDSPCVAYRLTQQEYFNI